MVEILMSFYINLFPTKYGKEKFPSSNNDLNAL